MVRILNFHPADWGSNSHFIYHLSSSISLINLFKSSHIFSYMQIYSDFVGFNSKFPILAPPKLLIASVGYQQYSNPLECTLSLEPYVHQIWCTLIILVLLFVYWDWLWFLFTKILFNNWLFSSTVFECTKDADCNNRGFCNNGECLCSPGWDEVDCSSK